MSTAQPTQPQLDDLWAVVLYAPEEAVWCSWIHRQLDGILVPEVMVGQPTRHGFPLPASITIFPDPNDPSKLAGYAEAVRKARYLIVVCSPASADAEAVEQQIRAFKRTGGEGGEERIVVLVVERELDEDSNTSSGRGGDSWLPPWIRWRLDEDGQFRSKEAGEPLIIDARPGRLSLDDARGELTTFLLDLGDPAPPPRAMPLVQETASAPVPVPTPAPKVRANGPPAPAVRQGVVKKQPAPATPLPKMAPIAPVAVPGAKPEKKGSAGLVIAAVLVLAILSGGAWMWMKQSRMSNASTQAAPVPEAASPEETAPVAEPDTTKSASTEKTAQASSPTKAGAVAMPEPVAVQAPSTPAPSPGKAQAAAPAVAAAPSATPTLPADNSVSEGPLTSITSIAQPPSPMAELGAPVGAVSGNAALDRWRKLRDLGDTLIERQNRDAGMIALIQAAETAEKYIQKEAAGADVRIEVARLCFRVGALQRQFYSPREATKTMEKARRILDRTKAEGEEAAERRQLLENIETFLAGMKE